MMKRTFLVLFLCSCISFSMGAETTVNQCSNSAVLARIRPGAAWAMQGDSIEKLKWLDKKQKKPTAAEVQKAKLACEEDAKTRDALKAQARLEVKNPATPVEKKVNDLILLLDLDR